MVRGWIGVDLDGTLAYYDRWRGIDHIGEPLAPMANRVIRWLEEGQEVRIFTARVAGEDAAKAREYIEAWCATNLGYILPITNQKDFGMSELWDDRCVQVEPNTGYRMYVDRTIG